MGLRLYAIYPNIDDTVTYTVQIMDEFYSGTSREIRLTEEVTYEYLGTSRDPLVKIIPTNARFSFIVNTEPHQDFVDQLITSDDGRFWLKILRGTAVDFIGLITADQTEIAVRPLDSNEKVYTITAFDSISRLKDVPYLAAQGGDFISQSRLGKFRVKPSSSQYYNNAGAQTALSVWDEIVENEGTKWNAGSQLYQNNGQYDFKVFLSIFVDFNDYFVDNDLYDDRGFFDPLNGNFASDHEDGFTITATLYKTGPTNLADPVVTTVVAYTDPERASTYGITSQRVTISFDVKDVVLNDNEWVKCVLDWGVLGTYADITIEENSYFENVLDATVSVKNVYASFKDHVANVMSQLPTHSYYGAGDTFFNMYITHVEANQGVADSEAYIGIPYNAFITDVFADPPETISAYEVLESLLDMLPGQLIYRGGQYYMHSYHSASIFNYYNKAFTKLGYVAKTFSPYPMICEGSGTSSYLMPLHRAKLCYERTDQASIFSEDVASKFPTATFYQTVQTADVVLTADRSYYLHILLRVSSVLKPAALLALETNEDTWRHQFVAIVQADTYYLEINNLNTFLAADPIYSIPTWETGGARFIEILGPAQTTIKQHTVEFKIEIPGIDYEGPMTLALEYLNTAVKDGFDDHTLTVLPDPAFHWVVDKFRLSTSDEADSNKIYKRNVCTELSRSVNSFSIDRNIRYSDIVTQENDKGAVRVLSGSDWVTPSTWSGGTLQMAMTKYLANPFATAPRIFNGQFIISDPLLGHARPDEFSYMLLMTGSFYTHMNRLQGSWWTYTSSIFYNKLTANTYIQEKGSEESSAARGETGSSDKGTGSPSDTGGSQREQYYFYVNDQTTVYIDVDPAVYRLPDPADYSEADMMRMFNGSKKGSGNLTYRETLARPEHFKVDFANDRIELFRAAENGVDYFFMWEIL